jgi:hypothetical protein
MDIAELFQDTNVISTRVVARAFDMSENDARDWADELDVAKIGASFAWAEADVQALGSALESCDVEDEDNNEVDDNEDDDDDQVDGDEAEEDDEP